MHAPAPYPLYRPRRLRRDAFTRDLVREHRLSPADLAFPRLGGIQNHRLIIGNRRRFVASGRSRVPVTPAPAALAIPSVPVIARAALGAARRRLFIIVFFPVIAVCEYYSNVILIVLRILRQIIRVDFEGG